MALSNRERVGRAFELLAAGLGEYVDVQMRLAGSTEEWLATYAALARPPVSVASLDDPALLLRIMADCWDTAFRSVLGKSERNLVFELRETRTAGRTTTPSRSTTPTGRSTRSSGCSWRYVRLSRPRSAGRRRS